MNWFLLFIILLMCGGGYYEYQTLHGQVTVDELQITDLKSQVQVATASAQKSSDDVTQLTSSLAEAEAKASDLQKQLLAAKAAQPAAQAPAAAGNSVAPGTTAGAGAGTPTAFTTKLGTFTALDGKIYANAQLLKVSADSIVISDADGVTQVSLNVLPPATQKIFGYDSTQGKLSDDQVQALELKRQQAMATGN